MTSIRHNTAVDDAYLDAAREAILAVGWSRTTLTDIARRAGVSRMTLYRRWPDTRTLLADLMTREWGSVVTRAAAAASSRPTARERATAAVVDTVRTLRTDALVRRLLEVDPEVLLPYLLERRGRSQEHLARATADLLRAGQADGSVRPGDPTTMARSLVLAAHGFLLSAHTMVDAGIDPGTGSTATRDVDVSHLDAELAHLVDRYLAPLDAPVTAP